MKKWLIRLLVFAGALGIVAVAAAWLALRASLPVLDGTLDVEGLSATARIHRDADGIPVITAVNRADLAFATGFAHGQDRFFQMDSVRRQAAGELSALIGPSGKSTGAFVFIAFVRARLRCCAGCRPRTGPCWSIMPPA